MMEAHDRFYVEQANYARTIPIPTIGVHTTEFDIGQDQAQALFDVRPGRRAAVPGYLGLRGLHRQVPERKSSGQAGHGYALSA